MMGRFLVGFLVGLYLSDLYPRLSHSVWLLGESLRYHLWQWVATGVW